AGGLLYTATEYGLLAALAGSLGVAEIARAESLGAELVGVRGSACEGGRLGRVREEKVRALKCAMETAPEPSSGGV
ncbi:MAG TPA: (5-formylfuran-3-yl)methyl phosphate synthase, partial [Longimicrobiales bacterium]